MVVIQMVNFTNTWHFSPLPTYTCFGAHKPKKNYVLPAQLPRTTKVKFSWVYVNLKRSFYCLRQAGKMLLTHRRQNATYTSQFSVELQRNRSFANTFAFVCQHSQLVHFTRRRKCAESHKLAQSALCTRFKCC